MNAEIKRGGYGCLVHVEDELRKKRKDEKKNKNREKMKMVVKRV